MERVKSMERVLRLWDRWSAISDVLDELKEMEGVEGKYIRLPQETWTKK